MKLIIDIPDEYYTAIKSIDDIESTADMLIVKSGKPLDEIISKIEQARDKDQIAEYPYNRCIKIIREVLGDD